MRASTTCLLTVLGSLALGLAAAGCAHPPRLTTAWAERARNVRSAALGDADIEPVRAEYGPLDDRDDAKLTSLDGDDAEDLREVTVKLGTGTFTLDAPVHLRGVPVTIEGEGPHKTRLELDTESLGALLISGAPRVELRGLTVVGYTGGGIGLKDCPDVRVEDVHFAGSRYGLDLIGSIATVGSSLFAGCEKGLALSEGARIEVRETVFAQCWKAISGRGGIDVSACAFIDNHDAIDARVDRDTSIESCMFAGEKQQLGWVGRPGLMKALLLPQTALGVVDDRRNHREVHHRDEFPDALPEGFPAGFDLAGVHLAILRAEARGQKDPDREVRDAAIDRAELHAGAARDFVRKGDLARAREAARIAVRYCGPGPFGEDVPEAVREVAELGLN